MDIAGILSEKNVVRFLLFLYEGSHGENEFKSLASNYYTIKQTLEMLADEGIIERDLSETRSRRYMLTATGEQIASHLSDACNVERDGMSSRIIYTDGPMATASKKK